MSQTNSNYLMQNLLTAVQNAVDRAGINQKSPIVYQSFMTEIYRPQSPIQMDMIRTIDQASGGRWAAGNGLHEADLYKLLQPWIVATLGAVEGQLISRGVIQPQGGYAPQQQGYPPQQGGYGNGYIPAHMVNPSRGIYDDTSPIVPTPSNFQSTFSPAPAAAITPPVAPADPLAAFTTGKNIVFDLRAGSNAELKTLPGILDLSKANYRTGEFENERITTVDIILKPAQNNAYTAGLRVFEHAPQEVIRGTYANTISYNELFHLPIAHKQFTEVATAVAAEYQSSNQDWRAALSALEKRNRNEWTVFSNGLCKLINKSIHRLLRTDAGAYIGGIEGVDDLSALDDRKSILTVTHHQHYWATLNAMVSQAFQQLLELKHLIQATDANFGDFIHCDQVEFYLDDRTKYDYGTFAEGVDRQKFIAAMFANHTVLRIPRKAILTNAIGPRLVQVIEGYQPKDAVPLSKIQEVGTKLLEEIYDPRVGQIDALLCLDKGVPPERYYRQINVGCTLDNTLILIR